MYDDLIKNAFQPLDVSRSSHPYLYDAWEEIDFKKSNFICEAGKIEKHFYIVIQGVQAIYILTPQGEKKVIGFSYDGSFSGVYDSFLKNSPSHYFLEALTDSKLIRISKENYDELFKQYPEFNYWGRIAHQELLIGRVNREVELITKTAKERFEAFMRRCPEELLSIPQKLLASYLNMTPETFSRMRASKS